MKIGFNYFYYPQKNHLALYDNTTKFSKNQYFVVKNTFFKNVKSNKVLTFQKNEAIIIEKRTDAFEKMY